MAKKKSRGKDMTQGMSRIRSSKKTGKKPKKQTPVENPDTYFDGTRGGDIRGDYKEVDVGQIVPNEYNYNQMPVAMFEVLKANIRRGGFNDPIAVRSGDENGAFPDGKFVIIDGEHRHRAAVEIGLARVPIIDLGSVGDKDAKALTIIYNETKGKGDEDMLAGLVVQLGGASSDLAEVLPFDDKELAAMENLGNVDWSALDNLGGVSVGDAPEEEDDEEGDEPDVIEFLGLEDMTYEQSVALRRRCERVSKHVKHAARPGGLLDGLLSYVIAQEDIAEFDTEDDDA